MTPAKVLALVTLVALQCSCATPPTGRRAQAQPAPPTICRETTQHHDGDTFTCTPAGQAPFVVRVASIDAPETGQAFWRAARDRLRRLASPGSSVDCYKVDHYGRRVCRLRTADGEDAAGAMLVAGLAWYAEDFSREDVPPARERYRRLQAEAQVARRGLWAEPVPMPPKTCRLRRQQGLSCQ